MSTPTTARDLATGLSAWTNPGNGFRVIRLHYTADPAKRAPEWSTLSRAGMPHRGWLREYELSWTSPEGEPVIPEFEHARHVKALAADPNLRLLRFWDFGRVTPAVLFAQLSMLGQLRILAELVPFNTPLDALLPMVDAVSIDVLGKQPVQPFDAGDPAATNETDLGCVKSVLSAHGIHLATSRPGTEASYERLRTRFRDSIYVAGIGLVPAIVMDPRCRNLIEACAGAFHLGPNPPYKPVKMHPFKDVVDALRYGHDNLAPVNTDFQRQMREMARNDWCWA